MRIHTGRILARCAPIVAAFALAAQAMSAAAAWPERPIRLIVPFAPGGSNDVVARVVSAKLTDRLGQPVVVENRGGAGGSIGTEFVAKSAPDGYTLLFASESIMTNAVVGKKLPYDPVTDLQPIGEIGSGPFVIAVGNAVPAKTLGELIALARAKPRTLNYGTAGVGGINHLGTELVAHAAGIKLVHVPYKGISLAFNDMFAGSLQVMLPSVPSAAPFIRDGRIRGLAVTSAQRSPLLPEMPTAAEAGLPGFELEVWWGLSGPAKLPAGIVQRLNAELNAALATPEMQQVLAREGITPRPGSAQAFSELIRADYQRWQKLARDAGLKAE
ncbi:tripartite tricarboxylate transporter substrate binding protein [Bordetella hinzii]|uniref:Tripartite tricarboxylate transporter substrate binding protein n=2 Tax=Bordetella hinzii TaxID=103855 RepID=A0AAN1RWV1_9BORD|nr:tripartite tricarboxylate transporter substrate binding protein [Bordetella hinzii]AKQ61529.1 Tripartite tricarboxylate transporter family receptor [Bordetella hinzii]AZW17508.1 tripartite tricarboxylate transporter substrate binding protein [Bordetella hinzii]KCB23832.1 tripartite tricarboxylate transporter family receptor [Bordetella hinzii OH87 BAL007II]KCB33280.1 tripartite tricarboxylate transporter family receptor [Bordetella hinzii CA90 BAL1384]KCB42437.1 tripartite tricarboxylate tr